VNTATTIDWLRFRTQGELGEALQAVRALYGGLGECVGFGAHQRGALGFQHSMPLKLADVTLGRVDWGGDSQRGWARVDLTGKGCGFVQDWDALDAVEALPSAQIRRVDIALTTWQGEITHDQVVRAHAAGKFTLRRPPNLQTIEHTDAYRGKTCYIGSRTADKFFRAYEKGKQLAEQHGIGALGTRISHIEGYRVEDIYRCELELKAEGTDIPWETIERRDQYFAGAYPFCAEVLPGIEPDILQRRPEKGPQRDLGIALATARHQFGRTLYTAAAAYGGDIMRVWDQVVGSEHNQALLEAGVLLVEHE
jgi:DNA relaxase NicK